jgi:outer membrane protein OmpA-like peptidoglycan-associated protein
MLRLYKGGMRMRKTTTVVMTAALVLGLSGCASWTKTQKGAALGGGAGAVVGGVIGKAAGSTVVGAILGAALGGAAGAYIGRYMDRQAKEMEQDLEGAKIERVGEGIKITFESGLLFDVDKAVVKQVSKENLNDLADILNKYPDTDILIEGHTDSTGSDEHNLTLSRQRAQAVSNYLAQIDINPTRFTIMGYGESQPVADNETVEGRALNRRVELGIMANDRLKKIAKERGGTGAPDKP